MTVTLTIKKVPVELASALRRRAAAHHRSLQGELLRLLEAAAAGPVSLSVQEPAAAFTVTRPDAGVAPPAAPEGRMTLAEAWERSRRIMVGSASRAPMGESAEILRRDRDAHEARSGG